MAENDLFQRLLAAESTTQVEDLVAANLQQVLSNFPGWTTVPAQIRGDPAALNNYGNKIILIAKLLEARGHSSPLHSLEGARDRNPIYRWQDAFARSRELTDAGRHAESIEILSSLLAEFEQTSGTAVEDARAMVLGELGAVWFEAGDISQAFHWTQRALQACVANDDLRGISTYRQNLQLLEALYLPTVDPEAGGRLLRIRRLIASAQAASNDFDYAVSNQALDQALAIIGQGDEHLRASFAGKIYGLRGWNYHYLKDESAARADTERALAECRAAHDPDGIRIYTANARFLATKDASPECRSYIIDMYKQLPDGRSIVEDMSLDAGSGAQRPARGGHRAPVQDRGRVPVELVASYPRPARWFCIYCGWECTESFNDYICKSCGQLRPWAGGSATMRSCSKCKQLSLAIAKYCEWCGNQLGPL